MTAGYLLTQARATLRSNCWLAPAGGHVVTGRLEHRRRTRRGEGSRGEDAVSARCPAPVRHPGSERQQERRESVHPHLRRQDMRQGRPGQAGGDGHRDQQSDRRRGEVLRGFLRTATRHTIISKHALFARLEGCFEGWAAQQTVQTSMLPVRRIELRGWMDPRALMHLAPPHAAPTRSVVVSVGRSGSRSCGLRQ